MIYKVTYSYKGDLPETITLHGNEDLIQFLQTEPKDTQIWTIEIK